ncbi:sigma-70 family RNA polymerase sigma factor [Altericroceibacterium spongiae]|uniref:Sigma-70 family RNA polymerase sigma factor n=2 Tax=Altericroceibacterium spongiae TaxID=2320269 RepID=A0A420EKS0_9SPHN|nr:sigma-70 family RNA polymerase sigma factor [Altericroceibacterium spongiae]
MSSTAFQLSAGMTRLKSYIRKRMRDPDQVEDIVQETLVRVMEQEQRQVIDRPLAYAFRVADSVILSGARKSVRETGLDGPELVCELPLADEVLDYRQRLARFEAALARLTPQRRIVFRMRHIDGKSRQEIAQELNLSIEAVKKHLVRAMADLTLSLEGDLGPVGMGNKDNG